MLNYINWNNIEEGLEFYLITQCVITVGDHFLDSRTNVTGLIFIKDI